MTCHGRFYYKMFFTATEKLHKKVGNLILATDLVRKIYFFNIAKVFENDTLPQYASCFVSHKDYWDKIVTKKIKLVLFKFSVLIKSHCKFQSSLLDEIPDNSLS